MRSWRVVVLIFLLSASSAVMDESRAGPVSRVASAATHPLPLFPASNPERLEVNPHSDLIFRATGATSCLDCHRSDKAGRPTPQVIDNAIVRDLKAKATGIHGPGRFADCLRCHAGGTKGVEQYRKR